MDGDDKIKIAAAASTLRRPNYTHAVRALVFKTFCRLGASKQVKPQGQTRDHSLCVRNDRQDRQTAGRPSVEQDQAGLSPEHCSGRVSETLQAGVQRIPKGCRTQYHGIGYRRWTWFR